MSDKNLNSILPATYFPEWWNIHTHRCNHHSRLPTFEKEHSLGRALLGDWGRIGAVSICTKDKNIKVVPQISNSLYGRLHYTELPAPVLPAHYLPQDCFVESGGSCSQGSFLDSTAAFDAGYGNLLNDALFGEQASAAFLIGKMQGIIRTSAVSLDEKSAKSAKVYECLEQLEHLATEGSNCLKSKAQRQILECIRCEIYPPPESDDVLEEQWLDTITEPSAKRRRLSIHEKHRASGPVLPVMLSKLCDFETEERNTDENRLLAAVDPFLIRLASRLVNPVFFGHGLLRTAGRFVFWSVPHRSAPPYLWLSKLSETNQFSPISVPLSDLPVSHTRMCELDVQCDDELSLRYNIVSRWDSSTTTNNVALTRIRISDDGTSAHLEQSFLPPLPNTASSICTSPWTNDAQFAIAGTHLTLCRDKTAYVRLYSLSDEPSFYWTCRVFLDDHTDGVGAESEGNLSALGLSTLPEDPVQSLLDAHLQFIKPINQSLIRASSVAGWQMGVRIGFASHPTELCLSTCRRLLLLDTRQCSSARELFSTVANPAVLNSSEYFTYVAPKFLGDVYALVTTPYSTVMVDKRMPGRTVLHTQHNLPAPPVYVDWSTAAAHVRERHEMPELMLAAVSQYPADTSLVGFNFTSVSGPQLVGPSLMGARLTPGLCEFHGELPLRLVKGDVAKERLLTSLCGLSVLPVTDEGIQVLTLTSHGDLFRHTWVFEDSHAAEFSQTNRDRISHWLSNLICRPTDVEPPYKPSSAQIVDLTQLSRLETPDRNSKTPRKKSQQSYWEFSDLVTRADLSPALANQSEHLVNDLESIWRENDSTYIASTEESSSHTRGKLTDARVAEERKRGAIRPDRMNPLGNYWNRFVSACATSARATAPGGGAAILHKSATEWQGLTDMARVLLRNCPASRLAVLDHMTPLFGEYFVLWWQKHHHQKVGQQAATTDICGEGFEDLVAAESVLCAIARMLRELVLLNSGSDEFASGVCSWVLARLRPACIVPPTQMLSSLRRLLNANSRSKSSFSWKVTRADEIPKHLSIDPTEPDLDDDGKKKAHSRVKESNLFSVPGTHRPTSSDSEASDSEDTDDVEYSSPEVPAAALPTSEPTTTDSLDLSSTSAANKQLLGPWAHCRVLIELLQLAYELIMGHAVRLSTIQSLLAIATVPLPSELSTVILPSQSGYIPSPSSVLPHWVVIWILYQVSRHEDNGTVSIQRLVDLILDASVQFPLAPSIVLDSLGNTPDTLTGWLVEKRVDLHFWITSCLTHLLFLGDQVGVFVSDSISRKVRKWITSSANKAVGEIFDEQVAGRRLISLILHLGLLSVPTPPSAPPTALQSVPAQASSTSSPALPSRPESRQYRSHGPDPSSFISAVHDGSSPMFKAPFSQSPAGGLYGRHFGPRHAHHPLRPAALPFPFANPPPPMVPPGSTLPGPGSLPNQTSQFPPWRLQSTHTSVSPSPIRSRGQSTEKQNNMGSEAKSGPPRQPASLIWLLNLAKCIRSSTILVVIDELVKLDAVQLHQLFSSLYTSSEKQQLLQMTTDVILTAPDGSGCDRLLTFLLDASMIRCIKPDGQDNETVEPKTIALEWLSDTCTQLLKVACTSLLCMVYARAESVDTLNRGGCEGLLRAAQRLATATVPYPQSALTNGFTAPRGSNLFNYLTNPNTPPSVLVCVCQLLVALELTVEVNLVVRALFHLCSASYTDHPEQDSSIAPAFLFFPLLEEYEVGRNARLLGSSTSSIPPLMGLTVSSSSSHTHSLLVDQLLPRVWTSVVESPTCCITLRSLLWLVQREKVLTSNRFTTACLLTALASQLVPMLKLMCATDDKTAIDLLLALFEEATALVIGQRPSPRHPCPQPGLTLSVSECISVGRLTVQLARTLLKQSTLCVSTPDELARSIQLFQRLQDVLTDLAGRYPLLRSTALRCATTANSFAEVCGTKSGDLTAFVSPTRNSASVRSFDWRTLVTPNCLPDIVLDSTKRGACFSVDGDDANVSSLLLSNPPPDGALHTGPANDSLARGQLRRRVRTADQTEDFKRPPGTNFSGSGNSEGPTQNTVWHPVHLHWLRLIDRLSGEFNTKMVSCTTKTKEHTTGTVRHFSHLVGNGLQNLLLPHGAYLPQTTIAHLPNPLALVLAPSGIGLERVIGLLHCFCPEVKSHAIGQYGPDNLATRTRAATRLLENSLFHVLHTEEHVQKHETNRSGNDLPATACDDPFLTMIDKQESLFPSPKVLLGLLMGLEAIWAGPLAPKISLSDALAYFSANEGMYAQGIFPIKWSPEVCLAQARRLAVDYGQRRVDCQSALFRLTKQLLIVLYKLCYNHDHSIQQSTKASTGDQPPRSAGSAHLPLDRLLYCVTPRELAILLSDIRRNLRLRMAFDWIKQRKQLSGNSTAEQLVDVYLTVDNLPPPPAFITPGLLLAVLHAHLIEPGVAELLGPLLNSMHVLHSAPDSIRSAELMNDPTVLEEVDVDGELVVVLND
ncbi:hypothetical protein T265_04656 [Opisthorchis viverrini]|uniref:Uncharacterized protein n=1 Tax=Opisthorchis viverrini TaxID=6198 RepID=A0A074ZRR1_OPIVI|nr:hypothetical protein T265_04656 [Opisthorchis viverrini]KER28517.1 hypothetical protein T265_04656 [Opisthorchis viverrini]